MKKKLFLFVVAFFVFGKVLAGGILTNTNQNVSFLRNPARDASTEIDAAYTNPAGLAFLSHEGLSFSINNQSAFQTRTITTDFAPFAGFGGSSTKTFEGKAKALVIPNLQAAYKTNNWVISANIGIVGGGGTLNFSKGLPSFESQFAVIPDMLRLNGIPLPKTEYSLDSRLKGSSLIIGVQLGATYKISDQFSAYLGGRMSMVDNSYDGYIRNFKANLKDGGQYNGMAVTDYLTTVIAPQLTGAGNSLQPLVLGGLGDYKLAQVVAAGLLTQAQADQLAANSGLSTDATVKTVQSAFFTKAAQVQGAAN